MDMRERTMKGIRWFLGLLLVVVGLSTTWAWGEVARLAGPAPGVVEMPPAALYAAWQADAAEQATLFRSKDEGGSWQPLALPADAQPIAWADSGRQHVAVVLEDGSLLLSEDQGETWIIVEPGLEISSLAWSDRDSLYLGTDGAGVYHLATDEALVANSMMQGESAWDRIVSLSLIDGRLFAATPNAILYTDDIDPTAGQVAWTKSAPLPALDLVTSIAATDRQTVYAGTTTTGVYKSIDAGQTWWPAGNGLGLAAGLMVRITALRSDPSEAGVLYAAVDHMVGSTQVHASAAGLFVTVDGGTSWQPLAGPSFPEARHASSLVLMPDRPLYAQAVTAEGLQGYAPDVMRILAALESDDPQMRASAARQLGMARPQGVWNKLLAALDDPDQLVSLAAAGALGRINDPAAIPGLLIAIDHPSEQVRLGAARALGMMQVEAAAEPLRAMLLRGEGPEVSVAGDALGHIGGPAATDALLTALADPQPTARWHVAMAALEGMGEPAVAPLLAMLNSENAGARNNAAQALGWIGSPTATEALVQTLKKDDDGTVRAQAAWALGEIGDPAARRALERAYLRDSAVEVQAAAEWALSRVPVLPESAASWASRWAPALNQLQPVRWLVLALSLAGGAWLMMGTRSWAAVPLGLRHRSRTAKR
jgi:HEAT repeat protein